MCKRMVEGDAYHICVLATDLAEEREVDIDDYYSSLINKISLIRFRCSGDNCDDEMAISTQLLAIRMWVEPPSLRQTVRCPCRRVSYADVGVPAFFRRVRLYSKNKKKNKEKIKNNLINL